MSVDIFGRSSINKKEIILKGPPGIGFSLTDSGDFDIQNKRLCNVSDPINNQDAVNLNVFSAHKKFIEVEQKKFQENILIKITELSDKINEFKIEIKKQLHEDIDNRYENLIKDLIEEYRV